MSIENLLLNKLKSDQSRFALVALTRPAEKTEWEYGYRVGVVDVVDLSRQWHAAMGAIGLRELLS